MSDGESDPTVPAALKQLADVQRLVLKGYHATVGLHIGLTVRDAAQARALLGRLAARGGAPGTLTRAEEWHTTQGACLTVGITFSGLRALGVPEAELATFPAEFRAGAAARAAVVGDEGPSRPAAWLPWLRGATGGDLHLLLSLLATDQAELDAVEARLQQEWASALRVLGRIGTAALTPERQPTVPPAKPDAPSSKAKPRDMLVHFGYRDGFSQPTIKDLPPIGLADPLDPVPVGTLVLGHEVPSIDRRGLSYSYPVPGSPALGRNGSFAAFRILEQDVHAFEEYLQEQERVTGRSKELIAAKLCGRWRDGSPLVLRPDDAEPTVPEDDMNDFDYAGGGSVRNAPDPTGVRCPLGAHVRRMNPRGTPVAGAPTVRRHRRLVRRGMPYGPLYEPGQLRDDRPRGLVGLFIGASLRDGFEFLMQEWANDGAFSAALGRTQDPLLGAHDRDGTATFAIPGSNKKALQGLPRFVTTRGSAYLFLPSAAALQSLAASESDNPAAAVPFVDLLLRDRPDTGRRAARVAVARRDDPSWSLLLSWFTTRRGALLRQLLDDGPFLPTPPALVVSGYDDVREVLDHPEVFSVRPYATAMEKINDGVPFVLGMDAGPAFDHDRDLLVRVLPREDAGHVRTQVRWEAPALLAVPGPVDVVRFAKALAVRVAAERFGLRGLGPDVLVDRCHEVFVGLFVNLNEDAAVADRAQAARRFLRGHVEGLVERARSSDALSDDVLGRLLAEVDRGTGLTDDRVPDQLVGLVVGLVDNAVAGICSAVDELLARPEELARAQWAAHKDEELLGRIVWEVLRFAPPAPLLVRETTQPYTFSRHPQDEVPAGRLVVVVTAGAMLDPDRFEDPESVRVDRPAGRSLHFGAGMHQCVGQQLGGSLVVEAVGALLRAGVRPAPEPDPGLVRRGDTPLSYVVHVAGS